MAYNTNLPPTIAQTSESTWELRDSTGSVIATYTGKPFDSPDDWWQDIITYVFTNTGGTPLDALNDLTLLIIQQDWESVDER
jgi:hypothetical protein